MSRQLIVTALICALLFAHPAIAQDASPDPYQATVGILLDHELPPGPLPQVLTDGFSFSNEGDTFLQSEATKPDNATTKRTVYNETDFHGHLNWSDWLTLNAATKFEHERFNNVNDFYPDRSSFLRSEGLTLRQFYFTVRPDGDDQVAFYGGKIHPAFGTGWSFAYPGIFYPFATDYEQDQMIGFGADAKIPRTAVINWLGTAHLSAETFFLDTTSLSYSLFAHPSANDMFVTPPGMFHYSDGGAGNTNGLSSVTASLRGNDLFNAKGLAYHFSFTHEGVHLPGEQAQTGLTAAGNYSFDLGDGLSTSPYGEYAWIENFNGQAGLTRHYVTYGLAAKKGKWELDLSGGLRASYNHPSATNIWDTQESLSLLYAVMDKFVVGGGYNHIDINNVGNNTVGLIAQYQFSL